MYALMAMRDATEIRKLPEHLRALLRRVLGAAGGEMTQEKPLDRPLSRLPVTGPLAATEAIEEDRAHPGTPD